MFRAPIPGQSLTTEPGNYAWEQPPKFEAPEDALKAHLERLNDPDRFDDAMYLLELGFPIRAFTEALITTGVMNGIHTVDVSVIIGPVIHEYLKSMAQAAGIEYDEGLENESAKSQKDKAKLAYKLRRKLEDMKEGDKGKELVSAAADVMDGTAEEVEEMPMQEPEMAMSDMEAPMPRKGLMAPQGEM